MINDKLAGLHPIWGAVVACNHRRQAPIREASKEYYHYYKRTGNITNTFGDCLNFYHYYIGNTHVWMQAI